ncbi:MAG TPA: TetR/AcrR family transcriptional regulator [Acidimicrobiales bacterium]|nr:TetR/AcrR family transcriptional regulator [Acidimicrobiales bacterium]
MRVRERGVSTERLLQATFACVARYGIAKTTVEDVAREAGVSRATVYRQFPGGKDQLVGDTIRWEATRFFAELAVAIEASPDFATTLQDAILFARRALGQHAVFQKVLETEPDLLLPHLSVDDGRIRGLVVAFLRAHLEPEADRLADGLTTHQAADHVARLLLSIFNSAGAWDLTSRDEVKTLVRTQLLSGVFTETLRRH